MVCLLTLHNDASYTISVRQYRILPCRFLQCIPHGKPPCVVLILPISFRAYKGLAPSGKKTPAQSFVLTKNSCIFGFFLLLCSRCALLMQGTHKRFGISAGVFSQKHLYEFASLSPVRTAVKPPPTPSRRTLAFIV